MRTWWTQTYWIRFRGYKFRHAEGEKQAGRASVHDCEAACLRIFRGG